MNMLDSEFLTLTYEDDDYKYKIHIHTEDDFLVETNSVLLEHTNIFRKGYSIREDPPHTSKSLRHVHIMKKRNQFAALNLDGTAHDGYHNVRLPNYICQVLTQFYPDFKVPENGIIEAYISPLDQIDNIKVLLG